MKATYKKWHDDEKKAGGRKTAFKDPQHFTPEELEVGIKNFMKNFLELRRRRMLTRLGLPDGGKKYEAYRHAGGLKLEVGEYSTFYNRGSNLGMCFDSGFGSRIGKEMKPQLKRAVSIFP